MSISRFRERYNPGPSSTLVPNVGMKYTVRLSDGVVVAQTPKDATFSSAFLGARDVERCWDHNNGRPPYDVGGPFVAVNYHRPNGVASVGDRLLRRYTSAGKQYEDRYSGGVLPVVTEVQANVMADLIGDIKSINADTVTTAKGFIPSDISELGEEALVKLRPKFEKANLLQSIYELREAPSMLRTTSKGFSDLYQRLGGQPGSKVMQPKKVADHFLNHQFGWKPFVRDVYSALDAVVAFDGYASRQEAINDQWQKRYFAEEVVEKEDIYFQDTNLCHLSPVSLEDARSNGNWKVQFTITIEEYTKIWYEGTFKMYKAYFDHKVPMHPAVRKARQLMAIAGVNVNPSTLWKITPYTWMIDWFSNSGRLIQQAEDLVSNSVVHKYAYAMRHHSKRFRINFKASGASGDCDLNWFAGGEAKQRFIAKSPFGFRLSGGGLSATQYAILGALGISKLAP